MESNIVELSEIITIAGIITASLVGAIGILWKMLMAHMTDKLNKTEEKLEECETKHEQANQNIIDLSGRLGKLEGLVMSQSKKALDEL